MSTQNKNKVWVVPVDQVKEFMADEINWKPLIDDCMKRYLKPPVTKKPTSRKRPTPKKNRFF